MNPPRSGGKDPAGLGLIVAGRALARRADIAPAGRSVPATERRARAQTAARPLRRSAHGKMVIWFPRAARHSPELPDEPSFRCPDLSGQAVRPWGSGGRSRILQLSGPIVHCPVAALN